MPLRETMDTLIKAQQMQARWQKRLALIIGIFLLLQIATFVAVGFKLL
jgi:hypothetical protein